MTAGVKRSVRRALEKVLLGVITQNKILMPDGATPAIEWPALAFDLPSLLTSIEAGGQPQYVQPKASYGPKIVREWGNTPRIELSGIFKVGIFTPLAAGVDMNDTLAGIVEAAYPYNADLVFGGIRVNIATVDHGEAVPVGAWLYSPVKVNWNVWRA